MTKQVSSLETERGSIQGTESKESDDGYPELEKLIRDRVASSSDYPLFATNADPEALWNAYLGCLPPPRRQHYNCHSCRRFIQRYGSLVTIDGNGYHHSALWSTLGIPSFFHNSFSDMGELVDHRSKVVGVFYSSDLTWGIPQTGKAEWSHLSGVFPKRYTNPLLSAEQAMALKLEEYKMVIAGLQDYPIDLASQALRILEADAVERSEKAEGIAKWFLDLHQKVKDQKGLLRVHANNLIWLAVANAPPGFAHIRSTMISTLLEDLKENLPMEAIARRWKEKMHPLQYQRPTAVPKKQAIEEAEKLVEKLGLARSFERRFATLDDVLSFIWVPRGESNLPDMKGGIFSHLKEKDPKSGIELPNRNITWEKFNREVVPDATGIEVYLQGSSIPFYGLLTAVHADAPPILQWDGLTSSGGLEVRNPVSWYFWFGGRAPYQWGLNEGWNSVDAVFYSPAHWQMESKHIEKQVLFAIRGCKETTQPSLCLFPEILKSELHGVRSVIEAHNNKMKIPLRLAEGANGVAFSGASHLSLRVRSNEGIALYTLDRMD